MPAGLISYDIIDDMGDDEAEEEDGEPGRAFNNHYWRYMRFSEGKARLVTVLVLLPLAEKDVTSYPELVAYMNRAVRQAEFPGFLRAGLVELASLQKERGIESLAVAPEASRCLRIPESARRLEEAERDVDAALP